MPGEPKLFQQLLNPALLGAQLLALCEDDLL
jgi:hypothetical protein